MKIIKNLRVPARAVVFACVGLAAVTALVGAALAAPSSAPHRTGHKSGETVARWNRNAISVLLPTNPPELTRSLAMTHIALHDAANAVRPKYERYAYHVTEDTGADPSAEAVSRREEIQIDRELSHRREEHQTPDRRAPRRREHGRVGPEGVGDDSTGLPVLPDV